MKTRLLIISLLLLGFSVHAQYHDFGGWFGLSANKKLAKDLSLSVNVQGRMEENYSRLGSGLLDFQLGYKFNKYLAFGLSYRFTQKNDYRTAWGSKHRMQLRCAVKKKFNPVTVQYRTIYQLGIADTYKPESFYYPTSYWRNKLQFKFDLDKKIEPYLGTEIFYELANQGGFDSYRVVAGLNWDLPKKMEIKTGYLFQQEINQTNPVTEHIIVIRYSIKL
ncbi:MAG: DUF2490 domain-containing protein [Flavobacteriales bacterium]|nr:DUF2490 domain-containing protein [Flavobacteriales bacterium]